MTFIEPPHVRKVDEAPAPTEDEFVYDLYYFDPSAPVDAYKDVPWYIQSTYLLEFSNKKSFLY